METYTRLGTTVSPLASDGSPEDEWDDDDDDDDYEDDESTDSADTANSSGSLARNSSLSIEDLSFSTRPSCGCGESVQILEDVTAYVRSGHVLAILGGSGAGKTTVLDAVARSPRLRGDLDGSILLNGKTLTRRAFRANCAYVPQEDVLWSTLTVQETLDFAAGLYQGRARSSSREEMVEELMEATGLENCRDVKVGDGVVIKGISGGQRRRVSIAVELLKRPSLLILDVPTSGLDSCATEAIVDLLANLAKMAWVAVMYTIHQPSSYVFQRFDSILVLAAGHVCYFGSATNALPHFERIGYPSEVGVNPAEFFIRLTNTDFRSKAEVDSICAAWSPYSETVAREISQDNRGHRDSDNAHQPKKRRAGCVMQVCLLARRSLRGQLRNPMGIVARITLASLVIVIICLAYLETREKNQAQVPSCVYVIVWIFLLPPYFCIGVLPLFLQEAACYKKEAKNGLYNPCCYLFGDFITSVPMWFIIQGFVMILAFIILAMNWPNFLQMWLLFSLYFGWNEIVAQLCGTLFNSLALGTMVFSMITIVCMLFVGTLLPDIRSVPWVLRWLFYVLPTGYIFPAAVWLEFEGLEFSGFEQCSNCTAFGTPCLGTPCYGEDGLDVIATLEAGLFPTLSTENTTIWALLILLGEIALLLLARALALFWLSR